jgi:hypothetical protein
MDQSGTLTIGQRKDGLSKPAVLPEEDDAFRVPKAKAHSD